MRRTLRVFSPASPKIRAVIFDGAGTLFDHRCSALLGLFGRIAAERVGKMIDSETLSAPIGLSKLEHFRRIYQAMNVPAAECDQLAKASVAEMELRFAKEVATADLVEGALQTIRNLQSEGISVAVNSSYPAKILLEALAAHGLKHLPWATPEQVQRGRPYPDMLNYLMEKMQATPEETLAVGDTVPDIQAAKAAGTWSALVTDSSAYARGDSQLAFNAAIKMLDAADVFPNFTANDVANIPEVVDIINRQMSLGQTPVSFANNICHVNPELEKPALKYNSNWHQ